MNRASSRSHAICLLTVERTLRKGTEHIAKTAKEANPTLANQREGVDASVAAENFVTEDYDEDDDVATSEEQDFGNMLHTTGNDLLLRGRISICDLAGSERIKKTNASGDRLNEAQQINLSLLELGNVIQALTDPKRSHVPFRNSMLTRLLQESFGGNCKTSLIVCVGPSRRDLSETKGALSFGYRAMRVKNCARVNVEIDYKAQSDALSAQMNAKEVDYVKREQALLEQMEALKVQFAKEKEVALEQVKKDKITFKKSVAEWDKALVEQKNLVHSLTQQVDGNKREISLVQSYFAGKETDLLCLLSTQLAEINLLQSVNAKGSVPKGSDPEAEMLKLLDLIPSAKTSQFYQKHVARVNGVLKGMIGLSEVNEGYLDRLAALGKENQVTIEDLELDLKLIIHSSVETARAESPKTTFVSLMEEYLKAFEHKEPHARSIHALNVLEGDLLQSSTKYSVALVPSITLYKSALATQLILGNLKVQSELSTASDKIAKLNERLHQLQKGGSEPGSPDVAVTEKLAMYALQVETLKADLEKETEKRQNAQTKWKDAEARAQAALNEKAKLEADTRSVKSAPAPPPKTNEGATQTKPAAIPGAVAAGSAAKKVAPKPRVLHDDPYADEEFVKCAGAQKCLMM